MTTSCLYKSSKTHSSNLPIPLALLLPPCSRTWTPSCASLLLRLACICHHEAALLFPRRPCHCLRTRCLAHHAPNSEYLRPLLTYLPLQVCETRQARTAARRFRLQGPPNQLHTDCINISECVCTEATEILEEQESDWREAGWY